LKILKEIHMTKTFNIKISNYKAIHGIPEVELTIYNAETGEPERICWLSAFRWYRFQVSGGPDGEGDYGSTPVFGLETLASIVQKGPSNYGQEATVKFIIEAVARDAINEFMFKIGFTSKYYFRFEKPMYNAFIGANKYWDKFINAVYDHIVNGIEIEDTPEE